MSSDFKTLIKDVTIVDGTGKRPYKGSIGILGNRISAIGDIKGDAAEVLEASGLTATPGFIDAHSHADWTLLWYTRCESHVMQGVTTFVGGQCGGSPAPFGEIMRVPSMLADHLDELDPHKYYPKPLYPFEQVNEWMKQIFGWSIDWTTMEGFFNRVESEGISMNYAPLVGHGNIRFNVMGADYKRHATQSEIDQMIEQIHQAMGEGCYGMSTGMDYDPDVFAAQDEIVKCVAALKGHNGVYSPHWRRTGRRRGVKPGTPTAERIDGIKDCIEVCRETGVHTEIAHLADCYGVRAKGVTPPSLETVAGEATIQVIDDAIKTGLPVTFDYIPIPHNDLRGLPYLCSLFTPWIRELGSPERLAEWLKMEDYREDIRDSLFAGKWHIRQRFSPVSNPKYWARNIIVVKHSDPEYNMKSIAEIANMLEKDPLDTMFDLITMDPYARASTFYRSRNVERVFLKYPAASICLDSSVFDHTYKKEGPPYTLGKEGTFDGFVSILIKYVREQGMLSIEEAVKKMSSNAALAYKLESRGMLKPGYYADINLIDIENLKVMSDNLEPRRYPKGIEYVFVNGEKVVEKGEHTGAKSGMVLRKNSEPAND